MCIEGAWQCFASQNAQSISLSTKLRFHEWTYGHLYLHNNYRRSQKGMQIVASFLFKYNTTKTLVIFTFYPSHLFLFDNFFSTGLTMDSPHHLFVNKIKKHAIVYRDFVVRNPHFASEIESSLRWISYLATGTFLKFTYD